MLLGLGAIELAKVAFASATMAQGIQNIHFCKAELISPSSSQSHAERKVDTYPVHLVRERSNTAGSKFFIGTKSSRYQL